MSGSREPDAPNPHRIERETEAEYASRRHGRTAGAEYFDAPRAGGTAARAGGGGQKAVDEHVLEKMLSEAAMAEGGFARNRQTDALPGSAIVAKWVDDGQVMTVPPARLLCVEFPGRVENPGRAIRMMGGVGWMKKMHTGEEHVSKLTFRAPRTAPHAAFGDCKPGVAFALRVRVRAKTVIVNGTEHTRHRMQTACLGQIDRTLAYSGLCDFQYAPPVGLKQASLDMSDLTSIIRKGYVNVQDQPLHVVPKVIARRDQVHPYAYQGQAGSMRVSWVDENGNVEHDRVMTTGKAKGSGMTFLAWGDTNIPTTPPQSVLDSLSGATATALRRSLLEKLKQLFARRPVWSRYALTLVLSKDYHDISFPLKTLTAAISYMYSSGPYRGLYIRLGYDVTKVPEDGGIHPVLYELMDTRLRRETVQKLIIAQPNALADLGQVTQQQHQESVMGTGSAPDRARQDHHTPRMTWPRPEDPLHWRRLPVTWTEYFRHLSEGIPRMSGRGLKRIFAGVKTTWSQYIDFKDPEMLLTIQQNTHPSLFSSDGKILPSWMTPDVRSAIRRKFATRCMNFYQESHADATAEALKQAAEAVQQEQASAPGQVGDDPIRDYTGRRSGGGGGGGGAPPAKRSRLDMLAGKRSGEGAVGDGDSDEGSEDAEGGGGGGGIGVGGAGIGVGVGFEGGIPEFLMGSGDEEEEGGGDGAAEGSEDVDWS